MIGIPLGWLYSNAGEWLVHKYVLHGLGKNKNSFWSFHWHEHHRESRRHDMVDPGCKRPVFRAWDAQTKEAVALLGVAAAHLPLLPLAPFFTSTVWFCTWRYYRLHRKAHLDPVWAREHLPWHVDHHLGRQQNLNWCVTHPFFDNLMGTRQSFLQAQREPDATPRAGQQAVPAA
jgi:hypothetical protein